MIGVDVGGTKILAGLRRPRRHRPERTRARDPDLLGGGAPRRDGGCGRGAPRTERRRGSRLRRAVATSTRRPASRTGRSNIPLERCRSARLGRASVRSPGRRRERRQRRRARRVAPRRRSRDARRCVMLTLGTGVGGGLVLDGRLYRGWAELGHVVVELDGPPCQGNCHGRGHLEGVASGHAADAGRTRALRRRRRRAPARRACAWTARRARVEALARDRAPARRGDRLVREHVRPGRWSLLGGGFGAAAGELILEPGARGRASRGDRSRPDERLRVEPARSGSDAGPGRRRARRLRGRRRRQIDAARGLRDADRQPRRRHPARARRASRGATSCCARTPGRRECCSTVTAIDGAARQPPPAQRGAPRGRAAAAARRGRAHRARLGRRPARDQRPGRPPRARRRSTRGAGDGAARRRRRSRRRSSRAGSSATSYRFLGWLPRRATELEALCGRSSPPGRIPPSRSSRRSGCRRSLASPRRGVARTARPPFAVS